MQQVPVLRGSADPQQTKLERWSSLAIAPLLGRLQRAGEIAPDANPLTLTLTLTLTRCYPSHPHPTPFIRSPSLTLTLALTRTLTLTLQSGP